MQTLREWRTDRLLSLKDVAEAAGVTKKTIIQVELGRQRPSYATMRRLSDALGVPAGEIAEFAAVLEERKKDAA
jgi:transcriptional regulator with XRE-family HTH domain